MQHNDTEKQQVSAQYGEVAGLARGNGLFGVVFFGGQRTGQFTQVVNTHRPLFHTR
ncbi:MULTISPECIES: hypothetical protein [Snodgrassella]|uniref:hypothetical protein n=1 Tax=Snodgrassella TaxID=1193515 RepID=UPI00159F120D|nr:MULTISPECIES: hypothetical protein [Snodgrassella]